MKKAKLKLHSFAVGDAVVLNRRDGLSQSAKVKAVTTYEVLVAWQTSFDNFVAVWVNNDELDQLVPFPKGCKFLAV